MIATDAPAAPGHARGVDDPPYGGMPQMMPRLVAWAVLAVLLLNVDMGFQTRVAIESLADTGEGSRLRQIVYLGAMVGTLGTLIRLKSTEALANALPMALVGLFLWASLTLCWSAVPGIGARRLMLTIMTALTTLALTALLPPAQMLNALRQVGVALAIASLALVVIAPHLAIHLPDDAEPLIVGDWRGVFYHKNIFGAVLAPTALLQFHALHGRHEGGPGFGRGNSRSGGMLLGLLLGLLWQSGSKTALALALAMMALLWAQERAERHPGWRLILGGGGYFAALCGAVLSGLWALQSPVETLIAPDAFTGRGYIWQSLLTMAQGKTLLGYGYQSVFQIGVQSPLAQAFSERFFVTLPHAHSAYVEMILSIGWIGLGVFGAAVIVGPLGVFFTRAPQSAPTARLCLALMLLSWLHGVLEAGLFDRDRSMWVVFLVAYGALRHLPRTERRHHGP